MSRILALLAALALAVLALDRITRRGAPPTPRSGDGAEPPSSEPEENRGVAPASPESEAAGGAEPAQVHGVGGEPARAEEAERRRREADPLDESPMPANESGEWSAGRGLYDPTRVPYDEALAALARRFAASDAQARDRMRRAISRHELSTLLTFARRAAVFAMRDGSAAHARDALAAIAMVELKRVDFRDVVTALAIIHHGAVRAGADTAALFAEAAVLAHPATAKVIRRFAARPAEERSLRDVHGFVDVEAPGGPGLLPWGFSPYHPTRDLLSVAHGVAGLLEADRYDASITLASQLYPVWLGAAASEEAVGRALDAIRAGAHVAAFLRPHAGGPREDYIFFAFLVEAASDDDARTLLDASRRVREEHHSVLGAAAGPLFCLLAAPAAPRGMEWYETAETLARFADGIAAVLARHARPS